MQMFECVPVLTKKIEFYKNDHSHLFLKYKIKKKIYSIPGAYFVYLFMGFRELYRYS